MTRRPAVESIELAFPRHDMRFLSYRYPPASVFPSGTVTASQIRDADPEGFPSEVRVLTGETLFVPKPQQEELKQYCGPTTFRSSAALTFGVRFSSRSWTSSSPITTIATPTRS